MLTESNEGYIDLAEPRAWRANRYVYREVFCVRHIEDEACRKFERLVCKLTERYSKVHFATFDAGSPRREGIEWLRPVSAALPSRTCSRRGNAIADPAMSRR